MPDMKRSRYRSKVLSPALPPMAPSISTPSGAPSRANSAALLRPSISTSRSVTSGSRRLTPAGIDSTSMLTRYTPLPGTGTSHWPSASVVASPMTSPSWVTVRLTPSTGSRLPSRAVPVMASPSS